MNYRPIFIMMILSLGACCPSLDVLAADSQFDPLKQITSTFPKTIEIKNAGRVLEFCPDNTCDAFQASPGVSTADLKDFAYLYVYFFSDYYVLQDWRTKADSKKAAERVLARPRYQSCKNADDIEAARCALRLLSSNRRIKLLFVRYDENQRNVVNEDLIKHISKKAPKSNE